MFEILQKILHTFLTKQCYVELIDNFNYKESQCLKEAATTAAGALIMLVSVFLKVPQLMKISKNKSGRGINVRAVLMELYALTAGASYAFTSGYPFSAWGEGMFLALQQCAVVALLLHYGSSGNRLLYFAAGYTAIVATVLTRTIPLHVLWVVQACNLPIMLMGKLMQCATNYNNGGTGQLSAASCALATLVCCARAVTTVLVTRDRLMLSLYTLAAAGNSLLLAQVLYYSRTRQTKHKTS